MANRSLKHSRFWRHIVVLVSASCLGGCTHGAKLAGRPTAQEHIDLSLWSTAAATPQHSVYRAAPLVLEGFHIMEQLSAPFGLGTSPIGFDGQGTTYSIGWIECEDRELGMIANGVRLAVTETELVEAKDVAEPPLVGGIRVPKRMGEGYLFWSHSGVFRSSSITGPLEPVAFTNQVVNTVSFGPNFVLMRTQDGERIAYDPKRRTRTPLSPPGLFDVAADQQGRVVARLTSGVAVTSLDSGRSWSEAKANRAEFRAAALGSTGDSVWLEHAGAKWFLGSDGVLQTQPVASSTLPSVRSVSTHVRVAPLLDLAMPEGVRLPSGHAALAVHNTIAVVDVATGQTLLPQRAVAAPGLNCTPLSSASGVLLACSGEPGRLVIISQALSLTPRIEKDLVPAPSKSFAAEVLVLEASCIGLATEGVACVRKADGTWSEYDIRRALAQPKPSPLKVARWVPKEDGGAVALVYEPTPHDSKQRDGEGGRLPTPSTRWALVDGATMAFRWFDGSVLLSKCNIGMQPDATKFVMTRGGKLRGYTSTGSLVLDSNGNWQNGRRTFAWLRDAGPRAMAGDDQGHFWQSVDYGDTWTEVAGPPICHPNMIRGCSELGCHLGLFLRMGWPKDPPRPKLLPVVASRLQQEHLQLECDVPEAALEEQRRSIDSPSSLAPGGSPDKFRSDASSVGREIFKLVLRGGGFSALDYAFGARAELQRPVFKVDHSTSRPRPLEPFVPMRSLTARFVEAFDPAFQKKSARISLRDWFASVARETQEDVHTALQNGLILNSGVVRPVLSTGSSNTAGWLVQDSDNSLWLRPSGVIRRIALEEPWRQFGIISGFVDATGKLFLLLSDFQGTSRIVEVVGDKHRTILEAAPVVSDSRHLLNPDALAVGTDGSLAVLRLPSGPNPASTDDPAWVIGAGAHPTALAPWTKVELGDSPACNLVHASYRTILLLPRAWVKLRLAPDQSDSSPESGMLALVRWSQERVCLDAIELPVLGSSDPVVQTRFVARFGGALSGVGIGSTLATPVRMDVTQCTLRNE